MAKPEQPAAASTPDDLADALVSFFNRPPAEAVEVRQPDGSVVVQRMAAAPPLPADFARAHGITADELHDFAVATLPDGRPAYPRFAAAYAEAQLVQTRRLREGADAGWYVECWIAPLVAACGWRPQPDIAHTPIR
jgi:hypothetical protein